MFIPRTPKKSGRELRELVDTVNDLYALDLPNPHLSSPSLNPAANSLSWRSYYGIKRLYFKDGGLNAVFDNLEDWIYSRQIPSRPEGKAIPSNERDKRLEFLVKLIDDAIYLLPEGANASFTSVTGSREMANHSSSKRSLTESANASFTSGTESGETANRSPLKRRPSDDDDDEEEFHTAPNSPVKGSVAVHSNPLPVEKPQATLGDAKYSLDPGTAHAAKRPRPSLKKGPSEFVKKLTAPDPPVYDAVPPKLDPPHYSFLTATTSALGDSRGSLDESFSTEITEPDDNESEYGDSIAGHMLSQGFGTQVVNGDVQRSTDERIVEELVQRGPFSGQQSFPACVPLRYRYELERIGRAWKVPFDRMLVGSNISLSWQDFWKWIEGHNQRDRNPMPEKSGRAAWHAATGDFKSDRHSEVVVLTGDMDWCSQSEPGILKLKLNPLRTEKACRFHRRFGSDRFMSLTIPAPSRPPSYFRLTSQLTVLRESIALWLTQNDHRCLGRTWRPFFVEEVKNKRKSSEPKFRVEFFAVDGVDFEHSPRAPPVAPRQSSDRHTPMTLVSLIEWHMPEDANISQPDCKLFQRFSLGLSKTFATAVLRPSQVLPLKDAPGRPVMNDGCALMSRGLANDICDSLGISNTPSSFQGRIAGAKGLWMVDRHRSPVSDDDIWIQVSDSQLKIKPHPNLWQEPIDQEQLTFEVVKWSKPLHPVGLNVQLLGILEHGGGRPMKEYISELTRAGIQALYQDFADVLQSNSSVLCRGLAQKMRPATDARRLEQWMMNETECIVRFAEAGFAPQTFYPLRKRLRKCLNRLLDRYVEELHIEVPLSTYAFCIADPYGILKEDEVHFGFSGNWSHGDFDDNLLDGLDVLVGRLPAHLPSDIQRRRAVWKPELRHFKDVIVFPTQGDVPLAHMLSGGDYDGDTPWICWDQNMVRSFRNSDMQTSADDYPPEYFGLTQHSTPMQEVHSTDDFLKGAFTFNLTLSNLGRCTAEHERIAYDEPESINSSKAKELACLLSHLVDGRKGGLHLSEHAWQQYRKTISPFARSLPAYRNPERKYKRSNIIDYLKFVVAAQEKHVVLEQLEKAFPEAESFYNIDEDLAQPWTKAVTIANSDKQPGGQGQRLHEALVEIAEQVKKRFLQWKQSVHGQEEYSPAARDTADSVQALRPPPGDHPLLHTWRNSEHEWQRLLASCTYRKHDRTGFPIQAFGETLCQMKASGYPSRTVANNVLECYKVNQAAIRRVMAKELVEEDEFEGEDAVEAVFNTFGAVSEGDYDPDDGMSVE